MLAFWALLATAIAKKNDVQTPFWALLLVLMIFAFLWSRAIWVGNERDKRIAYSFRNAADQVLRSYWSAEPDTPSLRACSSKSWSWALASLICFCLSAMSARTLASWSAQPFGSRNCVPASA